MSSGFTIHLLRYPDPEDENVPLYALLPDDETQGLLLGSLESVIQARDTLNRLIEQGEHEGEISHLDERLGWKWLTIGQALALALEVTGKAPTARAIQIACKRGHISPAERVGRDWRFPQGRFLHWLTHRPKPGPKPRDAGANMASDDRGDPPADE